MREFNGVRGRPNDYRGFVHKTILGIGGKVLSAVGNVVPLPGAGILRTAGNIFTGLSQSGKSTPNVIFPSQSRDVIPIRPPQLDGRPGGIPLPITDSGPIRPGSSTMGICDTREANLVKATCCGQSVTGNGRVNAVGQCAPPGYHWNKSGYFRKGGACSKFQAGFVEAGSVLVKNRKLNNANGPAQNRALKRIERGQDHAKRILRATGWRTISKQSSREMRMRRRSRH